MNNEIQFMDVIEPLKQMIADQAYQMAYKDAVIKTQTNEIQELRAALDAITKQQKEIAVNNSIEQADEGDK